MSRPNVSRCLSVNVYALLAHQHLISKCLLACAKKKSLNFAPSGSWHLKVGMETPENDFQIYRPINDPRRAICSLERGYTRHIGFSSLQAGGFLAR